MHYKNYLADVVVKHKVKISWPNNVPFQPPTTLDSTSLNTLLDTIRCGICKWENITKAEVDKMVQTATQSGRKLKGARAKRSDAGGRHKSSKGTANRGQKRRRSEEEQSTEDEV